VEVGDFHEGRVALDDTISVWHYVLGDGGDLKGNVGNRVWGDGGLVKNIGVGGLDGCR
jgi:hypothetical protein